MLRPAVRRYTTQDRSLKDKWSPEATFLTMDQAMFMTDLSPLMHTAIIQMEVGDEEIFYGWFYIRRDS